MTSTTPALNGLWDSLFFHPQPQQDSNLLEILGFIPGLKELLMLRQVHALEHGTVWILSEGIHPLTSESPALPADNDTLGGYSTEKGFYLCGEVNFLDVQRSVRQALERFRRGEWQLAIHPRCGTNASVNLLLTTTLAIGAHLILPRGPLEQLLGLGLATTTASHLSPELGLSVQKYLTTAIPFNLELTDITRTLDFWKRPSYFVELNWRDPQ